MASCYSLGAHGAISAGHFAHRWVYASNQSITNLNAIKSLPRCLCHLLPSSLLRTQRRSLPVVSARNWQSEAPQPPRSRSRLRNKTREIVLCIQMRAVRIQRRVTRTLFRRSRDIVDSVRARNCLLNSTRYETAQTSGRHHLQIYYLCVNNPRGNWDPNKYHWLVVDSLRLSELCLSYKLSDCSIAGYIPSVKLCCDTVLLPCSWLVNPNKIDAFNVENNIQRCNF